MESPDLQHQSFEALSFSPEFCGQARRMGVKSPEEVIAAGPERLIGNEHFTYSWLAELVGFLSRHESAHILQPIPGSIAG
jgi:hypothetical protein